MARKTRAQVAAAAAEALAAEALAAAAQPAPAPVETAPTGKRAFGLVAAEAYAAHPLTKRRETGGGAAQTPDERVPHVAGAKRRIDAPGKSMGVNRAYRVLAKHNARPNTYRAHLLDVVQAHNSTHAAIAAYVANPWPDLRPLDNHCFNWCANNNYIQWLDE